MGAFAGWYWDRLAVLGRIVSLVLVLWVVAPARLPAADEPPPDVASERFYSANALYNRKLYPVAIKEFESFLKDYPNHPKAGEARYGLALSLYMIGQYERAEPLLKSLSEQATVGNAGQLRVLRAHCLLALGKPAEAESLFAAVAEAKDLAALRKEALAGLADAQFKQAKWPALLQTAERLLAEQPGPSLTLRAMYQTAWAQHQLGRFKEAIPILEKLVELAGDDPIRHSADYLLGECYRETGDLAAAATKYRECASRMPADAAAEVSYRLGFVHLAAGQFREALAAFEQALKQNPKAPFERQAQSYIGRCLVELADYERARRTLEPVSRSSDPAAGEATLWLARLHSRQKRFADAAAVLAPATERLGGDAAINDLRFDYANALIAQDNCDGALKPLQALAGKADFAQRADVLRLLAICLHRVGDYAGSLRQAEEFLQKYPDDPLRPEVLFLQADSQYLLGRLDDALKNCRQFAESFPDHAAAKSAAMRVAQVLHKKGQWAEALAAAGPLLAATPQGDVFGQLRFVAGDCAFRLEKWDDAVTHLEAFVREAAERRRSQAGSRQPPKRGGKPAPPASEWEPNVDAARAELGVAYLNRGDTNAAAAQFKALLADHAGSPHAALALAELGRIQFEAGDHRAARETMQKLAASFPKDPRVARAEYYLGWVSLAENKEDEAAQHFGNVVKSYASDPLASDASLQLGLVLVSRGKFKEAQPVFESILKNDPKHPRLDLATFSLGVALARQEDWGRAAPHMQKVVETWPASDVADRALYEWAWCEKGRKRNEEAVKCYRKLIEEYPQSELADKVRTELAELTFDAKAFDEVIAQLTASLEKITDKDLREQTRYRLGTAHFNKGDFDAAARSFEGFLAEFPKSTLAGSARFQAGEARLKLKETAAARDHFAEAAKSGNAAIMESVLMRLGETQGLTEQWAESAATYERLLKSYPQSKWTDRARFGMGWALERRGDFAAAVTEYRKVLGGNRRDELSAHAQFQIGECLFGMKMYDAAIQELIKIPTNYRFRDWSARALLEMARVLEAAGQTDRAVEQYREVIEKYADNDAAVVAKQRLDVLRRTQ